jgi:hypothetical protein
MSAKDWQSIQCDQWAAAGCNLEDLGHKLVLEITKVVIIHLPILLVLMSLFAGRGHSGTGMALYVQTPLVFYIIDEIAHSIILDILNQF